MILFAGLLEQAVALAVKFNNKLGALGSLVANVTVALDDVADAGAL